MLRAIDSHPLQWAQRKSCLYRASEHSTKGDIQQMLRSLGVGIIFLTIGLGIDPTSAAQTLTTVANEPPLMPVLAKSICDKHPANDAIEALRLVCERGSIDRRLSEIASAETIVIGFVGGFVKADDTSHPEVLFGSYLRERYTNKVSVKVFSNHDEKGALSYIMGHLDRDHHGFLSSEEKKQARIVIYGHSWGASQTAVLAKELQRLGIPVLLTIQLDIISKFHQEPTLIPANVAKAINLYQPNGPLHGRSHIVAADSELTTILGNIRMEYGYRAVNCNNYNWFVRTFNRPHHEIENDPHVWDQIAGLIETTVSN
jgi:hypothetical protein